MFSIVNHCIQSITAVSNDSNLPTVVTGASYGLNYGTVESSVNGPPNCSNVVKVPSSVIGLMNGSNLEIKLLGN